MTMPMRPLSHWLLVSVAFVLVVFGPAMAQEAKLQNLGGGRFMTETVREFTISGLNTIRITGPNNLGGSLTVTTHPGATARLDMVKVFKVGSEQTASEFDRDIDFGLDTAGTSLTITVHSEHGAPWEGSDQSARVELTLTLPPDMSLEFRGRFFDMDLTGPFRRVDVKTEYGKIKVADVSERVRLVGDYTAIEATRTRGEIIAQTSYADLVVRDAIPSVEHSARLLNQFGSIVIEKLAGAVVAETENAPIFLSDVVLLGSGSSLRAANAMIKADIKEFSNAQLDVSNSNGTVILKVPSSLSARLNCSVGAGGSISTSGLMVQTHPDLIASDRLEGICGDGKGAIDVDVSGPGQIGIQGE
jgi:hypothetical protein